MLYKKIPIGISSCLLGEPVRFDSGHKNNVYIGKVLSQFFDFKPFCPEVSIGLGIPREPIRLVSTAPGAPVRCVGTKNSHLDVTGALSACATDQFRWVSDLCGYIVKNNSPSCGMERVKVYTKNNPQRIGVGIYTAAIIKAFPNLPVEEEGRLGDAVLRENFIKRVFIYQRWREIEKTLDNKQALVEFHTRHKHILMSHDQVKTRELGRLVAELGHIDLMDYCERYLTTMTQILRKPTNKRNHSNVLYHIKGHLKRCLDETDRAELHDTIEQYRQGYLPLIVPITILRHHFRKNPDPYIDKSYYMKPHPRELMLHNAL
ncbi:MAG: DUF523 and DUF1722 domain-containing protein [Cellvibrionaceae bacterium]|nr:DUF523 and DUF1722 domain-containing protein [Cellvibrionaceae bacterium]